MPVDTESDRWKSAECEVSTRQLILDFLESNSDRAFTPEEIAEEVLGTNFELDVPQEEGPLAEMIAMALGSTHDNAYFEAFINSHLSALVYDGDVVVKSIPKEVEDEEIEVTHYSIASS